MNAFIKGTVVFLFVFTLINAFSQYQDLERKKATIDQQKQKTNKEIETLKILEKETKRNRELGLIDLERTARTIELYENKINLVTLEVSYINKQIKFTQDTIFVLENELKKSKEEYAKMLQYSYKTRNSYSRILFIVSSESFNQAYRRLKYLQQLSDFRIRQAQSISQAKQLLEKKVQALNNQKSSKLNLLKDKETEVNQLALEREKKDKLFAELGNKIQEIEQRLKQKEAERQELNKKLAAIIAEEIKRINAEKEKNEKAGKGYQLSPNEQKLSTDFAANKGKLPWPVERGIITKRFGPQPHPVLANIKIQSNGWDFETSQNAMSRAVFGGTVKAIIVIPGANKSIIVQHGEYFSVYANLINVLVQKGDLVTTKQNLGTVYYEASQGKSELHFELWFGKVVQDPQLWLLSK